MNYYINPAVLSSVFTVPCSVVDNHLKFAKAEHIKVLLYILRNISQDYDVEKIALECSIDDFDVKEAFLYWADCGILMPKDKEISHLSNKKVVSKSQKPDRADIANRGEDPKIKYLLSQTQIKLGRMLKSNEASTLVWLYDDQGLDVSLILLIIQYAVVHNKANIRFIESTAVKWIEMGICDIEEADAELQKMSVAEQSWGVVSTAFGLERRKPSKKEEEYSYMWVNEWNFSKEMLEKAYEECVNNKSKFSFVYTAKILENWHEKGYKTPSDIEEKQISKKENFDSYDIDEFEKMLSSKD